MDLIEINIHHLTELDVIRLHLMAAFPKKNSDPFKVNELDKNEFLVRNCFHSDIYEYLKSLENEKFSIEFRTICDTYWADNLLISDNHGYFGKFPKFEHKNY